jgi:hypothetical protein
MTYPRPRGRRSRRCSVSWPFGRPRPPGSPAIDAVVVACKAAARVGDDITYPYLVAATGLSVWSVRNVVWRLRQRGAFPWEIVPSYRRSDDEPDPDPGEIARAAQAIRAARGSLRS